MDFNTPKKQEQQQQQEQKQVKEVKDVKPKRDVKREQTDSLFLEFKQELRKILERKLEENGF